MSELHHDLATETPDRVLGVLESVARQNQLEPLADRLVAVARWLGDDLMQLAAGLDRYAERGYQPAQPGETGEDDRGWQAARYLMGQRGKRLRPLCVLLAARLGDRALDDDVRNIAVSAELVHAATLLHDDVLDEGEERRGVPTARMVYGNSASILGGDHLLVEALRRVEGVEPRGLLQDLLSVIARMVTAEALQLERRQRFDPSASVYLQVVHGKTAHLFRWALASGGVLGGLPEEQVAALGRLGLAIGTAFQLVDDVLDLDGDPLVTGKSALLDLREGRMTWPLICATQRDPSVARDLEQLMELHKASEASNTEGNIEFEDELMASVLARVKAAGAIADTYRYAEEQADCARAELRRLPPGPAHDALAAVVEAVVRRKN